MLYIFSPTLKQKLKDVAKGFLYPLVRSTSYFKKAVSTHKSDAHHIANVYLYSSWECMILHREDPTQKLRAQLSSPMSTNLLPLC